MDLLKVKKEVFNERTGIINKIDHLVSIVGMLPLKTVVASGNPVIDTNMDKVIPSNFVGSGYDFDSMEEAEMGAVGEFIERYSSTVVTTEVIEASYLELKRKKINALNPLSVTRVSDTQLKPYKKIGLDLTEDTLFYWVEGVEEFTGKPAWIPTELVYLIPYYKNNLPIRDMISTGLATGNSLFDAKIRGLLECIERDATVIMWQNQIPFPRIKLESIKDEKISKKIEILIKMGLEVTVLDISNDIDLPVYFIAIQSDYFPYLSVGAGANFDQKSALTSALKEAMAVYNTNIYRLDSIKSEKGNEHNNINFFEFTSMDDHSDYYALNNLNDKIIFWKKGPEINFNERKYKIGTPEELFRTLKELKLDFFSINLTTKDLEQSKIFVVRTIVPKLAFLEVSTPMGQCERLESIPKKLGINSTVKNPLIHPFP